MLPSRVWTGWPVFGQKSRMACVVDAERPRAKESMLVNEHLRKPEMKKEGEESSGSLNTLQGWWFLERGTFSLSTQQHKQTQSQRRSKPVEKMGPRLPELRLGWPGSITDYRSCDVSFPIWSCVIPPPINPPLPKKWILWGGSSNNFIHICVHHVRAGFCLLNLWLTFLSVIKSSVYEWTSTEQGHTQPHPAAMP